MQKNSCELFSAWNLIIQVASRCPKRGILADQDGIRITSEDMEFKTRFPKRIFDDAFSFFSHPDIGWLDFSEISHTSGCHPEISGQHPDRREGKGTEGIEEKDAPSVQSNAAEPPPPAKVPTIPKLDSLEEYASNISAFYDALTESWYVEASKAWPHLNIRGEVERSKRWLFANSNRRKKKLDAFLNRWLNRAAESRPGMHAQQQPFRPPRTDFNALARLKREREAKEALACSQIS